MLLTTTPAGLAVTAIPAILIGRRIWRRANGQTAQPAGGTRRPRRWALCCGEWTAASANAGSSADQRRAFIASPNE
jgi:hypothetical protein